MSLRERMRDLAASTEREVLGLFDRWQQGEITEREFVSATAAAIARADGRAVRTADRAAAVQLSRMFRREVPPSGETIEDPRPRLRDAVTTLLSEQPEVATTAALLAASQRRRLGRLARNEPLQRAQEKMQDMFARNEAGWTRGTGPDACPLCDEWDDGQVRPATVDMPRHANCSCVQRPARL